MNRKAFAPLGAALALFCASAPDAARAEEAATVGKRALTLEGAKRVADAAAGEARRNHEGAAIAVVDDGGNLLYLERLDDTFTAGASISIGKARTAALFKKPTAAFEEIIKGGRTAMVALNDFTPLQGGVPIEVDGAIVGAIGVSGAANQQQDEAVAKAGAEALAGATLAAATSGPPVSFFDAEKVRAAFAKGDELFRGTNYTVIASRRDGPGQCEIHTEDTDVIYVQGGSATFVTGGTCIDPKPTEPGELRGSGIRDGDTRKLEKGDVVIVPHGTPHWFEDVGGPVLYYVVKVR
jgi:uncharacterized protein GlcG (DUF336 family)/mannose-6-phosphate isomerase-like protein (cupin superfamily)